jgi:hypothetical protein
MIDSNTALAPTPVRLGQERRFPIALSRQIDSIRALYDRAKQARWNPMTDIDWALLHEPEYDEVTLDAARLVWSRRAWLEYPRLSDTPALLIRFCLELDRESDPKYFLTVKNTEEAWQIETYHRIATAFGGYLARPPRQADERLFDQYRHVSALSNAESLDAYFAAHCAVEAEIELQLYTTYLANARNPAIRQALEHIVAAKARHAEFGWCYLEVRASEWDDAMRAQIGKRVDEYVSSVELAGYHCAILTGSTEMAAATDKVAADGLGAVSARQEAILLAAALRDAGQSLLRVGIESAVIDAAEAKIGNALAGRPS